jgi:ureidoglycolate hydrolase
MIKINSLSAASFRKYGTVLEQKNKKKVFSVIAGDKDAKGWRIGYLIFKPAPVDSMEAHPLSMETFEPVSGTTVIIVAQQKTPEIMEAFLLDRPVCVAKNVWHAVRVVSESAEIKITENFDVDSVIYKLKKPVDIGVI